MPRHLQYHQHADEQTHITDAGHEEGLLRRRCGRRFFVPEADEEEGGEAHQFPEDEGLQQIDGVDETEHRPFEQRQHGEVTGLVGIVAHISQGVDHHTERDQRHGDAEHQTETIQQKAKTQLDIATGKPQIAQRGDRSIRQQTDGASQRQCATGDDDELRQTRQPHQQQYGQHEGAEGGEGRRQNQTEGVRHPCNSVSSSASIVRCVRYRFRMMDRKMATSAAARPMMMSTKI